MLPNSRMPCHHALHMADEGGIRRKEWRCGAPEETDYFASNAPYGLDDVSEYVSDGGYPTTSSITIKKGEEMSRMSIRSMRRSPCYSLRLLLTNRMAQHLPCRACTDQPSSSVLLIFSLVPYDSVARSVAFLEAPALLLHSSQTRPMTSPVDRMPSFLPQMHHPSYQPRQHKNWERPFTDLLLIAP